MSEEHPLSQHLLAPPVYPFKIESGGLYTMHTSDTVGAVAWGVAPALLPCCLGARAVGVKVLPAGFQYGRHFIIVEHSSEEVQKVRGTELEAVSGQRSRTARYFSFVFPTPPAVAAKLSEDGAPVSFYGCIEVQGDRTLVAGAYSLPIPCLESKGDDTDPLRVIVPQMSPLTSMDWNTYRHRSPSSADPDHLQPQREVVGSRGAVPPLGQLFHLVPLARVDNLVSWHPKADASDDEDIALFGIEPAGQPGYRLVGALHHWVVVKPQDLNSGDQVFLIRPRAPYLITDFVIDSIPFIQRLREAFDRRESDYRRCRLQHSNPLVELPPRKVLSSGPCLADDPRDDRMQEEEEDPQNTGGIVPQYSTHTVTVKHDFQSSQLARTVKLAAIWLQLINYTTTLLIAIGVGYPGETDAAIACRVFLYVILVLVYVVLWIAHNQYYCVRLFEYMLRRGYILDVTPDVVHPKYLFTGGWNWYWFAVVAFLCVGGVYIHYFQQVTLGTSWLFFSNSTLFLLGVCYKLRSSFDDELMSVTTFVKSFDHGLLSRVAIHRAGAYLQQLVAVQGCVSVANPAAYTYLGQLPHTIRCCWGWGAFSARITIVLVLAFGNGALVIAFVIVRAYFLTELNGFSGMNACILQCSQIPDKAIGLNVKGNSTLQDSVCRACICLCAQTLNFRLDSLQQDSLCMSHLNVPGCRANATCISYQHCNNGGY